MEVHAHTHTERKKWTHYLWEFLMLFLAVFCGFLAEYQLEHKIEKDREKQYMRSLVEDLQLDSASLNSSYTFGKSQLKKLDTLINLIYSGSLTNAAIPTLYMFHYTTSRAMNVSFETRTSAQLKNSGGMRLVHRKMVADSLLSYWKKIETLETINGRIETGGEKISDLGVRIFSSKFIISGNIPLGTPIGIKEDVKFIDDDPKLFEEYANRQYVKQRRLENFLALMLTTKTAAVNLMEIIRKAYHFD